MESNESEGINSSNNKKNNDENEIPETSLKIQEESFSISHLPSFMSGFSQFGKKGTCLRRLKEWIGLSLKQKRKCCGRASLANRKRYVEKITKLVHAEGISQEIAENLVDSSIVNVINIILKKEKETGVYKFFQKQNPGLAHEKDLPLAWYGLEKSEKDAWIKIFENPDIIDDEEDLLLKPFTKRMRKNSIEKRRDSNDPQPSQSNANADIIAVTSNTKNTHENDAKDETTNNVSSSTNNQKTSETPEVLITLPVLNTISYSFPDAIYESQRLIKEITKAFIGIKLPSNQQLFIKYLKTNSNNFDYWYGFYKYLIKTKFRTLCELETAILDKLKEIRENLNAYNLTRYLWFEVVKEFITARNIICGDKLVSSISQLYMDEFERKFTYKKFKRAQMFSVVGDDNTKIGYPDFVYVKDVSHTEIIKIQKVNMQRKTFTGYLFTTKKPDKLMQNYQQNKSPVINSAILLERVMNQADQQEFNMHQVIGKCLVLNQEDYYRGRPNDIPEKDVYLCTTVWNLEDNVLVEDFNLDILRDGLNKYWGEIYYFKFDGSEKILHSKQISIDIEQNYGTHNDKEQELFSITTEEDHDEENPLMFIGISDESETEETKNHFDGNEIRIPTPDLFLERPPPGILPDLIQTEMSITPFKLYNNLNNSAMKLENEDDDDVIILD